MPGIVGAGHPRFQLESIPAVLSSSLDGAQRSAATHRKNSAICYKLLYASISVVQASRDRDGPGRKLVGETAFKRHFKQIALDSLLHAKRGLQPGDKVVKFIATFIAHAVQQDGPSDFQPNVNKELETLTCACL